MRSTTLNPKDNRGTVATVSDDDDITSSSGSSSSESESENGDSEDEDDKMHDDHTSTTAPTAAATAAASSSSIPSVPGRPKPQIHRVEGGSDLLSRISTFLPKMKDANESLEREIAAGRGKSMILDEVDDEDGKDYIEMNLGLGVLEEKRGDDEASSSGDESDDEGDGEDSGPVVDSSDGKSKKKADSDVLDKLMGGKQSAADKPSIEEMAE